MTYKTHSCRGKFEFTRKDRKRQLEKPRIEEFVKKTSGIIENIFKSHIVAESINVVRFWPAEETYEKLYIYTKQV